MAHLHCDNRVSVLEVPAEAASFIEIEDLVQRLFAEVGLQSANHPETLRLFLLTGDPTRDELKIFRLLVEFRDHSVRCFCNDFVNPPTQVSDDPLTVLCSATSAHTL